MIFTCVIAITPSFTLTLTTPVVGKKRDLKEISDRVDRDLATGRPQARWQHGAQQPKDTCRHARAAVAQQFDEGDMLRNLFLKVIRSPPGFMPPPLAQERTATQGGLTHLCSA